MNQEDIDSLLQGTYATDPKERRTALMPLCPCHVRSDVSKIWDRLFELQFDKDSGVRSIVLHHLTDGSPKSRETEVVAAIERLAQDSDLKLRRRARRALSTDRQNPRSLTGG